MGPSGDLKITVQPWTGKNRTSNNRSHGKRPALAEESPSEKLGKKKNASKAPGLSGPVSESKWKSRSQEAWGRRGQDHCKGQASLAVRTGWGGEDREAYAGASLRCMRLLRSRQDHLVPLYPELGRWALVRAGSTATEGKWHSLTSTAAPAAA